jgi:twitching motility protein PilT
MRRPQLDAVLKAMLCSAPGISDLVFATGKPLQVESDGVLRPVRFEPDPGLLTPVQTERIALNVIGDNSRLLRELLTRGACDCAYTLEDGARFRVNIYKQRGHFSLVMRRTQSEIASLSSLGFTPIFRDICKERNGLILVTGATGSGKTTTLSAILDEINASQAIHIVTLEDPIEHVHEQKLATFSQRELGSDFESYAEGMRAAMRQAPKVILVGEMRDRATVEIALSAAETGHLVLSTLPTINSAQTVNRLLGMVDSTEHAHLRQRLTESLRYIISQRLVPKIGGGRVLVQEVIGTNLRVRETLTLGEAEGRSFYDIIEANATAGWCTFDQSLTRACLAGLITEETAQTYATNKNKLTRLIDEGRKRQGTAEKSSLDLQLDAAKPNLGSLSGLRVAT